MTVILDLLIWLFERAYLVAYNSGMAGTEHGRRNSSDDRLRACCRRDDLFTAWPPLLRGEAPEIQRRILGLAQEGRASAPVSVD